MTLRFLTAGESHGKGLVVILEGIPAGLALDSAAITADLRRRQSGYGRGRRMTIEADEAEILSGVRLGETIGSPVALLIPNTDWRNWQRTMGIAPEPQGAESSNERPAVTRPRPGHADLAGALKYDRSDIRDVIERASARETAARVAAGSVARQFLGRFGIQVVSHVFAINGVGLGDPLAVTFQQASAIPPDSPLHCTDRDVERRMVDEIDKARDSGDTVGGAFEVIASGIPAGLGSYIQWDRRLDGRLAQALMSIPAVKAVGIGRGVAVASSPGSRIHDEVLPSAGTPHTRAGLVRPTNNAGGLEGGVTNGEDVRITGYMKPIATLMTPLRSIDLTTLREAPASIERSDVCAVPSAAVVGEAMVCLVVADALLEKFGGDSIGETARNLAAAEARVQGRLSGQELR